MSTYFQCEECFEEFLDTAERTYTDKAGVTSTLCKDCYEDVTGPPLPTKPISAEEINQNFDGILAHVLVKEELVDEFKPKATIEDHERTIKKLVVELGEKDDQILKHERTIKKLTENVRMLEAWRIGEKAGFEALEKTIVTLEKASDEKDKQIKGLLGDIGEQDMMLREMGGSVVADTDGNAYETVEVEIADQYGDDVCAPAGPGDRHGTVRPLPRGS